MERTTERSNAGIDALSQDRRHDHTYERAVIPTELPLELLAERLWRLMPDGLVEEIREGAWWHRVGPPLTTPR
jgi:hypothetical protein